MHQKSGYVTVHVYRGWGVTIYPPYKKISSSKFQEGEDDGRENRKKGFYQLS